MRALGELGRRVTALLVGAAACVAACGRTGLLLPDIEKDEEARLEIELINREAFQKVDLLFVVDNSISMTDKQLLFADAVPTLLKRLISPQCLDEDGNPTGAFSPCPAGTAEFRAIDDIHVGVITSSLGDHGGDVCRPDPGDTTPRTLNDRAELLPAVRGGLYSYDSAGFLVWDPRSPRPFPDPHPRVSEHEASLADFIGDFASHVRAAGEKGCGFEATLEAWYRFLIDPEPVTEMTSDGRVSRRGPVNALVLEQRARFLRPDSLVAVVVLTDENDCSVLDENGSQGWLVGIRTPMPRATSQCANGNTRELSCCRPCGVEVEGCPSSASDSECQKGAFLTPAEDSTNLRCTRQRERFGLDLLYPTGRYVDALTEPTITRGAKGDSVVPNPLFAPGADGTPSRDGRAFLVGIVGVPWQDIADPSSFEGRALRYLDVDEFAVNGPNRWDVILGDPSAGVEPLDPFMIESVDERYGMNPVTRDRIEPSTPGGPSNPINGHEQHVQGFDDLQYACTFALPAPLPCSTENQDGCDCNESERYNSRSICQYPSLTGDGTQTGGKAYPGLRHIEVLKGLGHNAVLASVCPKNMTVVGDDPVADPDYGYNPAVGAMVSRLTPYFSRRCLPHPLAVDADGRVPCSVVEAMPPESACACEAARGLFDLDAERSSAIVAELARRGYCDGAAGVSCAELCLCELEQLAGNELSACQSSGTDEKSLAGFCYVDGKFGDPDLIATCSAHERQDLRFMGEAEPPPWFRMLVCPGPAAGR